MIDVFTEEIEVQIKRGISNLYWYKEDLRKAWLRSNVEQSICNRLFNLKNDENKKAVPLRQPSREFRHHSYSRHIFIDNSIGFVLYFQ